MFGGKKSPFGSGGFAALASAAASGAIPNSTTAKPTAEMSSPSIFDSQKDLKDVAKKAFATRSLTSDGTFLRSNSNLSLGGGDQPEDSVDASQKNQIETTTANDSLRTLTSTSDGNGPKNNSMSSAKKISIGGAAGGATGLAGLIAAKKKQQDEEAEKQNKEVFSSPTSSPKNSSGNALGFAVLSALSAKQDGDLDDDTSAAHNKSPSSEAIEKRNPPSHSNTERDHSEKDYSER